MTTPTRDDVASWTVGERAEVARLLDEVLDRPDNPSRPPRQRRIVLAITGIGAIVLIPWILILSATLPTTSAGGAWKVAWIGFDIGLALALGLSAWSVWRRRQLALVFFSIAAALLTCDAWFDVCLSWSTPEQTSALATALVAEIPLVIVFLVALRRMMRRTALVIRRLRGIDGAPPSLWRQPMVMVPSRER
jgi:hypothetical protein